MLKPLAGSQSSRSGTGRPPPASCGPRMSPILSTPGMILRTQRGPCCPSMPRARTACRTQELISQNGDAQARLGLSGRHDVGRTVTGRVSEVAPPYTLKTAFVAHPGTIELQGAAVHAGGDGFRRPRSPPGWATALAASRHAPAITVIASGIFTQLLKKNGRSFQIVAVSPRAATGFSSGCAISRVAVKIARQKALLHFGPCSFTTCSSQVAATGEPGLASACRF